jgi:hypothetical protein
MWHSPILWTFSIKAIVIRIHTIPTIVEAGHVSGSVLLYFRISDWWDLHSYILKRSRRNKRNGNGTFQITRYTFWILLAKNLVMNLLSIIPLRGAVAACWILYFKGMHKTSIFLKTMIILQENKWKCPYKRAKEHLPGFATWGASALGSGTEWYMAALPYPPRPSS